MAQFKVGDVVPDANNQLVTIISTNLQSPFSIGGLVHGNPDALARYTLAGGGMTHVDLDPYQLDEAVYVRDYNTDIWRMRHFAYTANGTNYAWADGISFWGAQDAAGAISWNQVRRPTAEEIEELQAKVEVYVKANIGG